MRTVGIKVLKNNLSEYVRVAAAGETVLVTDRGKVVAELIAPRGPADTPGMTDAERQMAELVRQGHVTPAQEPRQALVPAPSATMTLEEMLRDLDDSRADRFHLMEEEYLADLVRQGVATPATVGRDEPLPPRQPPTMTFEGLMRDLDESRADR